MKVQVVYYSQTNNTKKLADAIGEELSCQVSSVNENADLTEAIDVLFLGGAIYKFGLDKNLVNYIDKLDSNLVKKVAVFGTSATSNSVYAKMKKLLIAKNIKVLDENFYCRGKFLFTNLNRPNEQDIEDVKLFAKKVINL